MSTIIILKGTIKSGLSKTKYEAFETYAQSGNITDLLKLYEEKE